MAEGKQAGALNQRAALPPLLPFGLDPDQHFASAVPRATFPLPTEQLPVLDDDLCFAGPPVEFPDIQYGWRLVC